MFPNTCDRISWRRMALSSILCFALSGTPFAAPRTAQAETVNAAVTLVAPVAGTIIHTGGMPTASPTITTNNHYVEITGAPPIQHYNAQSSLEVEIDGNILQGAALGTNQLITCHSNGNWKRYPNGNTANGGSLSGSRSTGPGQHTATGFADLVNNTTMKHATKSDDHAFTIINP